MVYDHPEFFWIKPSYRYYYNNDGYITKVCPSYYTQDIDSLTAEVEQSVNGALANMWALSSDVEKVKYAHDYLTQTIDYVRNDMDQSAYSGFVWKQTVCTGYSKCFAYMMHKMGIPSAVVVGSTDGINHAWNILELDGEYYLMDVNGMILWEILLIPITITILTSPMRRWRATTQREPPLTRMEVI